MVPIVLFLANFLYYAVYKPTALVVYKTTVHIEDHDKDKMKSLLDWSLSGKKQRFEGQVLLQNTFLHATITIDPSTPKPVVVLQGSCVAIENIPKSDIFIMKEIPILAGSKQNHSKLSLPLN